MNRVASRAGIAVAVLALAAALLPVPGGIARELWLAATVTLAAIALLASQALPEHVTAIAFLAAAVVLGVAPPEVVFGGFHTSVVWLIFAGIVIGFAIQESGLAAVTAHRVLAGITGSFRSAVIGILAVSLILSFALPATLARLAVLIPIAVAVCDLLGYPAGSRARTGLMLAVAFGSLMPSYAILPANLPNIVIAGGAESLYGTQITYGEYLLWHFPVIGLFKVAAVYVLVMRLYGREEVVGTPVAGRGTALPVPGTPRARIRLMVVLALTLIAWITDFVHHVSPGWVALVASAVLLVPRLGLVRADALATGINLGPFIYLGGVLGIGTVASHTGLGGQLAAAFVSWAPFEPDSPGRNYAVIGVLSLLMGHAMTLPAASAVLVSLAGELSQATGLPLKAVLGAEIVGLTTIVFPYVTPPLVFAVALARIPARDALRFTALLAALTVAVFSPLNFLWWKLMGFFG